jgi:hypothetical protein
LGSFLTAAASFPTAIFSTLLGVVLVYWLFAVIGVVDIDADGLHVSDAGGVDDLGTLAGIVNALGLGGVPLSIAASVLVLVAWTLSCLGGMWLVPLLPDSVSQAVAGAVLALGSVTIALPFTNLAVRPLRGLFVTHTAQHNVALVGQSCKVLTGSVDEKVGRAEVPQLGANINIRVWSPAPNAFKRGSSARIVAYEEGRGRYRIEPESPSSSSLPS